MNSQLGEFFKTTVDVRQGFLLSPILFSLFLEKIIQEIDLTSRLVDEATAYGMEVSTEESKVMTNSANNISAGISMNGQKLEEVTSFKYLGANLCKDGTSSAEVRIRVASTMAAMARLNRIWRFNTSSFASKFKLYKSLVTPILHFDC